MNYGMFSDAGNQKVAQVVEVAFELGSTWDQVCAMLSDLAKSDYDRFGEANDTAVREAVYDALAFGD